MEQLSNEILLEIFGLLDEFTAQKQCVLVSKRWFQVIRNSSKVSNSVTVNEMLLMKHKITDALVENWPKVSKLCLRNNGITSDLILSEIDFNRLENLKYINLKVKWMIVNKDLDTLLYMERCNFTPSEILEVSTRDLDQHPILMSKEKAKNVTDISIDMDLDSANYDQRLKVITKFTQLQNIEIRFTPDMYGHMYDRTGTTVVM